MVAVTVPNVVGTVDATLNYALLGLKIKDLNARQVPRHPNLICIDLDYLTNNLYKP
jgi:hypothetical protein